MLFQGGADVMFIVALIIGTIILTLIMYVAVRAIESKHKASDKKLMILLCAFIVVLVFPLIEGAIGSVLGAIAGILVQLRNLIAPSGQDHLSQLTPIILFLLLFILVKVLIDVKWENSVWVSLLSLFLFYIILTVLPEIGQLAGL